jgi:hypothetical protein
MLCRNNSLDDGDNLEQSRIRLPYNPHCPRSSLEVAQTTESMFRSNSIATTDPSPPPDVLVFSGSRSGSEPSQREVLLLNALTCVLFVLFVSMFRNYFAAVDNFGDSSAYMTLASAIRHWGFRGIVVKQFWGLPYAMAALSGLTGASGRTALLLISFISSFSALALAYRLWGGWVAGFFAVLSLIGCSAPIWVGRSPCSWPCYSARLRRCERSAGSWRHCWPPSRPWCGPLACLRCWESGLP